MYRHLTHPHDELVGTERAGIEERPLAQAMRAVKVAVLDLAGERFDADAQFAQQSVRHRAVGPRAVDLQRAAVQQLQPASDAELVALGVAAEVVVIVENQNAAAAPGARAEEMRRRQAADTPADDDQVVTLAAVGSRRDARAFAQRVGRLERARMAAAQTGEHRRVVAGPVLRRCKRRGRLGGRGHARQQRAAECGRRADQRPLEKIAARDAAIFAQTLVPERRPSARHVLLNPQACRPRLTGSVRTRLPLAA